MYINIDNVESPLEFIRDRLDVHIKNQIELKEKDLMSRSDDDELIIDESVASQGTEYMESLASDEQVDMSSEAQQVSDISVVDGQILQTIIEKDEYEIEENVTALQFSVESETIPLEATHPTQADDEQQRPNVDSEKAQIPNNEEPQLPFDVKQNVGIVTEIRNDILENVLNQLQVKSDQDNQAEPTKDTENDQPDSDEAVPFYDIPEEMEVEQIVETKGIEKCAETKEQNQENKSSDIEKEAKREEEDEIDAQCISKPLITAESEDETSGSTPYDDCSSEIVQEFIEFDMNITKRKLSILPDDAETIYLASKSYKVDEESSKSQTID